MSTIHIKKENRGKFNATKKRTGKSTEELTHSKNPKTRKRAIFAQNAKKWHHAEGGTVKDNNKAFNNTPMPTDYLNFLHGYGAGYDIHESTLDLAKLPTASLKKFYGIELDKKGKQYADQYHEWLMNRGDTNIPDSEKYRNYGNAVPSTTGGYGYPLGGIVGLIGMGMNFLQGIQQRKQQEELLEKQRVQAGIAEASAGQAGITNSFTPTFGKGGGIYIKPSKRGTFTAAAKQHGKSVQGFASQVLANKDNYSPAMVKKANFARNASKWHHAEGGLVFPIPLSLAIGGVTPYGTQIEVETGEILRNPNDGSLVKISEGAPSHADGGVVLSAEPGTQIFGKLKVMSGRFKGIPYKDAADKIRKEIALLNK